MPGIVAANEYPEIVGPLLTIAGIATGNPWLIKFGITLTLNAISEKLFAPKLPKGAGLGSRQVTSRSALEYRKVVYGEAMVSGPIAYNNVSGSSGEYLWYVIALADGASQSLEAVWFDNDEIPEADIDWTPSGSGADGSGTGDVSTAKWVGDDSTNAVNIQYYLGHPDQVVCGDLDTAFVNIDSNFRGRGVTYMVVKLTYVAETESIWSTGVPSNMKALLRGRKIYDPRLDSTNGGSGTHRYTDSTTWAWSDNPALCVADYLMTYMDVAPATGIDWTSVSDAADDCDTLVVVPPSASPENTEKRFTCNGALTLGQTHQDNLDALLSSCDGRLSYVQGQYKIRAGVWEASSLSVVEDDIIGTIDIRGSAPKKERCNLVRGFFIDPSRKHQASEFPHVTSSTYLTRDDSQEIAWDIELPFTNSEYMAQRIAYRQLEQGDNQVIVSFTMNVKGVQLTVGDVFSMTIDYLSWSSKTFRCIGWERAQDGSVKITAREDSSASYDDPTVGEYTTGTASTVTVPSEVVPAPSALTAISRPYGIEWNWTNPASNEFDYIDVYVSSDSSWSNATLQASVYSNTWTQSLASGQVRYAWVRARRYNGDVSARNPDSDTSTVMGTAGDDSENVQLTGATLSDQGYRTGDASVGYRLDSTGDEDSYQEVDASPIAYVKIDDWLVAGLNSDYEARLTNNSGTSPSGSAVGSWLALSTARAWTLTDSTAGGGAITSNNTVEIRDVSVSPAQVLASAPVVMTVDKQLPTLSLAGGTLSSAYNQSANAEKWLKVDNDGKLYEQDNASGYTQIESTTAWIIPNSASPDDYEVRYTNATGDTSDITATTAEDTWYTLSSGDWTIRVTDTTTTFGGKSVTFDLELRKGGSGAADESASYTISADREDPL